MRIEIIQKIIDVLRGKNQNKKITNKWFLKCYKDFIIKDKNPRFNANKEYWFPCLDDCTEVTDFEPHYTYHPVWAAQILAKTKPEKHVDISSSLKFCTMLSPFIQTEFYDYRPAKLNLDNLKCGVADLCNLPFEGDSIKSLSCMHVIEHIGLGRYGDNIDPEGDLKAIKELKRVLAVDGDLFFVVPMAEKPMLQFNAHRIYSYDMIADYFKELKLQEFSLITHDAKFIKNTTKDSLIGEDWGCGCFWFKKEIINV